MTRPRVLITYPYPLGQATGGARMTREIARFLGRAGADVTLLPVSAAPWSYVRGRRDRDEFLGFEYDRELARDAVSIERVPPSRLHWVRDGVVVAKAVDRLLQRFRVDLVLSYFTEAAPLLPLLRSRGVKFGIIATVQSYAAALRMRKPGILPCLHNRVNRRLIAEPLRQADVIFATSEFTRRELIDLFGIDDRKIVVSLLGVQPRFFSIPRPAPAQINRLLFFGRIVPAKGIREAFKALGSLVRRGHTDWSYRLFGHGNWKWVDDAIAEQGIEAQVEVRPALLDDDQLCEQLEWAHAALLPSHFEAFGLAFAEAQAAGLPVLAYDAGSVPEIVEHGVTGWLAPRNDVEGLTNWIEFAMQNPAQAHAAGLAGRERVRRKLSWQNTAHSIARGFRAVCGVEFPLRGGAGGAEG